MTLDYVPRGAASAIQIELCLLVFLLWAEPSVYCSVDSKLAADDAIINNTKYTLL